MFLKMGYEQVIAAIAPSRDVYKRPLNGHIKTKLISHVTDFDALEQEWSALAWASDTTIFQTFEWNRIWWTHFGTQKKLHIITVYSGRNLVGIAPMFEDDISILGRRVYTCLRLIGSFVSQPAGEPLIGSISYSDYLDCIILPEYEDLFYESILQHLSRIRADFNELILDEASSDGSICKTLIPLMAMSQYGLNFHVNRASSSPTIQLESTWEGFLNSMSVKDRYNARRYFNRSKHGSAAMFTIEKIKNTRELKSVLNDFFRMHQTQWNHRGFAGTFSEKRMCDFFEEMSTCFYAKNWIEFNLASPVDANTTYVAVDAYLTYKNKVHLMHRGMDEDPLYRKRGPGNVMLFARIHQAIQDGVDVFDMLRGSEEFKIRLATHIKQNKTIVVGPDDTSERLRIAVVKTAMKLVRLIRIEVLQLSIVIGDKPFFKALTDYTHFLFKRIKPHVWA